MSGEVLRKVGLTVLAWSVAFVITVPMLWMVSSSFKAPEEILANPPTLLPKSLYLGNFVDLFQGDFVLWFRNSVIVALGTVAVVIVVGTLGAYSIARFEFAGRKPFSVLVLFTYLFPSVLMLVPLFLIITSLGLNDTYLALILANTTFALPFAMWLLRAHFLAVPIQIEEAALVDGARRLRAFVDVVIPQVTPGIISTAIFAFIMSWNDYLFALVFTSSSDTRTLPVGIAGYTNNFDVQWGVLMAASVSVTVPVLVMFMVLQKRLIPGLNAGGVKA